MAPDRGHTVLRQGPKYQAIVPDNDAELEESSEHEALSSDTVVEEANTTSRFLAERASSDSNFTIRGVVVGACIGIIICFSNTYFGLQTGWISGMPMPSALIGYAYFKTVARYLSYPFTPVENVLVQTVAGAVGTMPLGAGFVGVIPALNFLLKSSEQGPLSISLWRLILWAVGICFFGVFIAVPLRKEVLIREKLKFPSGTATALMIGVLHGEKETTEGRIDPLEIVRTRSSEASQSHRASIENTELQERDSTRDEYHRSDWKRKIRLLVVAFALSALYVCKDKRKSLTELI